MDTSNINTVWTVQNLLDAMTARGTAPAVMTFEGDEVTQTSYAELASQARQLASGFLEAGIAPGEAIGIYAPNSVAWSIVRLAAGAAGLVTVAIDDVSSEAEAVELLIDCDCQWLFTSCAHAEAIGEAEAELPFEIYLLDASADAVPAFQLPASDWQSALARDAGPLPDLDAATPTSLVFTSGTTGAPKAFTLSHANIATNVEPLVAEQLVGTNDRVLLPLPLHHVYPLVVGLFTTLASGAALVLPEAVTGPRIAYALRAGRVTTIVGVPRLYTALLANLRDRVHSAGRLAAIWYRCALAIAGLLQRIVGLRVGRWVLRPLHRRFAPALRFLACGGAHLDMVTAQSLERLGWRVLSGYGLAETASMFTANFPKRQRAGSEGRALPGGEVRIAGPDEHGVGEIELRGASVTAGYHNNPQANEEAFTTDGWFRTGDLGRLDSDGYLYVTGRSKEVIVLGGGKNVNPEDLERLYGVSKVIEEIAILEEAGQLVALVRPNVEAIRASGLLSVEDSVRVTLAEAGQQLPSYERLAGYALTSRPLPRTRLGKYRRFLLPGLYEQATKGSAAAEPEPLSAEDQNLIATPPASDAWDWLKARYPDRPISPSDSLQLDLGVDSLEWLQLSLTISERFGVELDDADVTDMVTVRDLLQRIVQRTGQTPVPKHVPITHDPFQYVAPAGPGLRLLGAIVHGFIWCLMRILFRLSVRGVEHVPTTGPAVIVANHASYLDALVVAAALPSKRARHVFWGGAVPILFQSWISRVFCRVAHVFPIDERTPKTTLDIGDKILARGDALVWFPEAWRTPTGELQEFRTGIGTLLTMHPAPVVAAYIDGTFAALPRNRRWPRFRRLAVRFAPPVEVASLLNEGTGATDEGRIAKALHDRVAALGNM